jgi:hypothetical protein
MLYIDDTHSQTPSFYADPNIFRPMVDKEKTVEFELVVMDSDGVKSIPDKVKVLRKPPHIELQVTNSIISLINGDQQPVITATLTRANGAPFINKVLEIDAYTISGFLSGDGHPVDGDHGILNGAPVVTRANACDPWPANHLKKCLFLQWDILQYVLIQRTIALRYGKQIVQLNER